MQDNRGAVKQQSGKISKEGVYPKRTKPTDLSHATYYFNDIVPVMFFDRLITGEEKWFLYDNPRCKRYQLSSNESPRGTVRPGSHPKKTFLCIWRSIRGSVHFEVMKSGKTVNADLYCEQLDRVNQFLIEKCPPIVNRQ